MALFILDDVGAKHASPAPDNSGEIYLAATLGGMQGVGRKLGLPYAQCRVSLIE